MDIQKEMEIAWHQSVVGCKGTPEGEIFDTWIKRFGVHNIHFICSLAYNLGHIQGIRNERVRRKAGRGI